MNTTVCFVRHGETKWNALGYLQGREDIELNEMGEQQAIHTAAYLSQFHWDAVMASPLKRARKTAELISGHLGIQPIMTLDDLIERDLGAASGLSRAELAFRFPDGVIQGQETWDDLISRLNRLLNFAVDHFHHKRVVMVSHGGAINALLSLVSDGDIGTGKTLLHNACINLLEYDGQQWVIDTYNFTDHLR